MTSIAEVAARISPATLTGIREYVEHRTPPGCFLGAVRSNDLRGAVGWADDANKAALADIVAYLHWRVPARCWGSAEAVNAWLLGGRHGQTHAPRLTVYTPADEGESD
jgi:hypothetical protein